MQYNRKSTNLIFNKLHKLEAHRCLDKKSTEACILAAGHTSALKAIEDPEYNYKNSVLENQVNEVLYTGLRIGLKTRDMSIDKYHLNSENMTQQVIDTIIYDLEKFDKD